LVAIGLMLAASYDPAVTRGVGVILGLLLLVAACRGDSLSEGPLRETSGGHSWSSAPVKVGQFLVTGVTTPKNESGHEVVLERLEPVDDAVARGLELRYAAVDPRSRTCRVGALRDWPPLGCRGETRPVNGFRVPEGEAALILVGARAQRTGRWSLLDFRLRYRIGGHHYATSYGQGMKLRVVRKMRGAKSSASFSSFRTETGNIACAYAATTRFLACNLRSGRCYEMALAGSARRCSDTAAHLRSAHVLKARETWLYHGYRCHAGHASVHCRNQNFKGFFLSARRSHRA
jgi:hypothetical protein